MRGYQWVTKYHIQYTEDGFHWVNYQFGRTFDGNSDRNSKKILTLDPPIRARTIRLVVDEFVLWPSMRVEFIFMKSADSD